MLERLRMDTNPLYYIVVLTTTLWILSFAVIPFVNSFGLANEYTIAVFAIWGVLPVAMTFDVGILRQRYSMSILCCLLLIFVSAMPLIAPLSGVTYIWYRARVVSTIQDLNA